MAAAAAACTLEGLPGDEEVKERPGETEGRRPRPRPRWGDDAPRGGGMGARTGRRGRRAGKRDVVVVAVPVTLRRPHAVGHLPRAAWIRLCWRRRVASSASVWASNKSEMG